jgi:hypothetical protein
MQGKCLNSTPALIAFRNRGGVERREITQGAERQTGQNPHTGSRLFATQPWKSIFDSQPRQTYPCLLIGKVRGSTGRYLRQPEQFRYSTGVRRHLRTGRVGFPSQQLASAPGLRMRLWIPVNYPVADLSGSPNNFEKRPDS